jgi:hypothetical protein
MIKNSPACVAICTYRVRVGKEEEFLGLLRRHWPTLRDCGFVDETPSQVYKGNDESGGIFFVEILTWKDPEKPNRAHEVPQVMSLWEPMGMCCEARLGRPAMEFPTAEQLQLDRE